MAKAKPKGRFMVADGSGGMASVMDRRFETCDWPIRFEVPGERADTWFRYFYAECERRGWSSSGVGQIEARENSGSISVNAGGLEKPQLAVVWEWKRSGPIKVRARSAGVPEFPLAEMRKFFEEVNERCRSAATERFYRRGQLDYSGLPWRGDVWFDDSLRLGPPSKQDETALLGPRVVLVDALVDGAGQRDATEVFLQFLKELSVFLSVVMGTAIRLPEQGRTWTWTFEEGAANSDVRNLGYIETESSREMPERGACRSMPLRLVTRPDFSKRWIDVTTTTELSLPADVADLWAKYRALTPDRRREFLQAATKWQEALSERAHERGTLSYALMVVACEALKPSAREFRNHNIYDIVEALLGKSQADRLKEHWFRPQDVRSAHLHRGEFRDSEYVLETMMSNYQDPTFDLARRELASMTQAAIIEWLRLGGIFTMPILKRRKNLGRWIKEHSLTILPVLTSIGIALGVVSGWMLARLVGFS